MGDKMKCVKCGKRLKENEVFCTICGYYNGEVENNTEQVQGNLLDDDINNVRQDDTNIHDIINISGVEKKENTKKNTKIIKKKKEKKEDSSLDENNFYYENEVFLEAYIGEDYNQIKKWPFNIWAFLLNWMYLLYRKLYVTGIVGLLITGLFIVFLRKYLIIFIIIIMIVLGFLFNYYYVFVAKKKVEKILKRMEGTDNFTLMSIMKEEGGVDVPLALSIYAAFLLILFFYFVGFRLNSNHNTKYWKENSENKANCVYLTKLAYMDIQSQGSIGEIQSSTCKITKGTIENYEVYIKALYEERNIYIYYVTENGKISYKDNTSELLNLELMQANMVLTPEQSSRLANLKSIESNYQDIFIKSKREDELIAKKKNSQEKLNYSFEEEEIIR